MIYTSYFKAAADLSNTYSVYKKKPPWFARPIAPELCADEKLYKLFKKEDISDDEFIRRYLNETLFFLEPEDIVKKYDEKILLGWHKDNPMDCRFLISMWLKANLNYDTHELTPAELKMRI